ncbi:RNA polymerase sigma-70 factor [Chryseolinea lacunae]|uniref:RNA polymerase sigma-70 factor n=1 Tax=Chryseolinea lacunae TaxID=2801331 RepID=A0ABS1KM97_9BACT|nr:RNA polymerase sigma-70 factor [Chryseolinea lacunae]
MKNSSIEEFQNIFRKHHKGMCDMACNIVGDADAAKDIVQEVFMKLWTNRERLDLDGPIKHYLAKATAHTAYNHLRFNKKIHRLDDHITEDTLVAYTGTETLEFQEFERKVKEAIDKLPPQCRTVYVLSRQENMKYQEIADVMGLSLKTVENQMGIALDKLRGALKPFMTIKSLAVVILIVLTFCLAKAY